jgi:hypothetical protein
MSWELSFEEFVSLLLVMLLLLALLVSVDRVRAFRDPLRPCLRHIPLLRGGADEASKSAATHEEDVAGVDALMEDGDNSIEAAEEDAEGALAEEDAEGALAEEDAEGALAEEDAEGALAEEDAEGSFTDDQADDSSLDSGSSLDSSEAASVLLRHVPSVGAVLIKRVIILCRALPWSLMQVLIGLGMCFFGGTFTTSIAAVEAFMMTGGETARSAVLQIHEEVCAVLALNTEDDEKDEDGDGIADTQQLDGSALFRRKALLVAGAVKDPERLVAAVGGVYAGWIAVQATLRLRFAKTITLGVSLSNMFNRTMLRLVAPIVAPLMPMEVRHWVPTLLKILSKALAVAVVWRLQQVSSALQSAVRGGFLVTRGLLAWANAQGLLSLSAEDSLLDEALGMIIAACGFATQWIWRFDLPFVLDVVMFPLHLLEWWLRFTITH